MRISASQLGTYGECAFRHFAEKRLEPQRLDIPTFDALRIGTWVHACLFTVGAAPGGWADPDAVLDACFAAPLDAQPAVLASRRAALDRDLWQARLREWARTEAQRISQSAFQPAYHELAFGLTGDTPRDPASRPEPVTLRVGGRSVAFSGSIDRVDCWTDAEGARWGIALDYKTGKLDTQKKGLENGREIQLPLYLRVLEALGLGIRPAGALYISPKDGAMVGVVRAEFAQAVAGLSQDVQRCDDAQWREFLAHADAEIAARHARMSAGEIRAWPAEGNCGYCDLKGLCRIDLWRARRETVGGVS